MSKKLIFKQFTKGYDYMNNRCRKVVRAVWIVVRMLKDLWQS